MSIPPINDETLIRSYCVVTRFYIHAIKTKPFLLVPLYRSYLIVAGRQRNGDIHGRSGTFTSSSRQGGVRPPWRSPSGRRRAGAAARRVRSRRRPQRRRRPRRSSRARSGWAATAAVTTKSAPAARTPQRRHRQWGRGQLPLSAVCQTPTRHSEKQTLSAISLDFESWASPTWLQRWRVQSARSLRRHLKEGKSGAAPALLSAH